MEPGSYYDANFVDIGGTGVFVKTASDDKVGTVTACGSYIYIYTYIYRYLNVVLQSVIT